MWMFEVEGGEGSRRRRRRRKREDFPLVVLVRFGGLGGYWGRK